MTDDGAPAGPPHERLDALFLRFLRFGLLAWGGPVAQIAMIRQELVEDERWITRERFNRVLGVYQVLPGPEATELCVYFGMLARGRIGGFLAGLGFVAPGLVLMLAISALYARFDVRATAFQPALLGAQAAVCALIVRGVHRIGQHALTSRWLWAIAVAGFVGGIGLAFREAPPAAVQATGAVVRAPVATVLVTGLKAGLLTFGGAYTAIPFVREDAVIRDRWVSEGEFLDSIALSGLLPAPLIIFATMVGYLGAGAAGGLVMTAAIFAPAFSFTLVGHGTLERIVENRRVHGFLDAITAAVVGLIAATSVFLLRSSIHDWRGAAIFAASLAGLYAWRAKAAVAVVMIGAAVVGFAVLR
jgi:chromate transporter